jgi:hypothetical protein
MSSQRVGLGVLASTSVRDAESITGKSPGLQPGAFMGDAALEEVIVLFLKRLEF